MQQNINCTERKILASQYVVLTIAHAPGSSSRVATN